MDATISPPSPPEPNGMEALRDSSLELLNENDSLALVSRSESPELPIASPSPITEEEAEFNKDSNILALEKIDSKCAELQQVGRYTEALEWMEKGLVLRQHFFGSDSPDVWDACKTVGELCNLLAMTYLQQEEFGVVLELLKKAEILTERDNKGRAVTLNNWACYYRRQGQLQQALAKLTLALDIESKLERVPNRADTHLNMCAVLSQLGRHQGALEHAQSALILLHEELFCRSNNEESDRNLENKKDRIAVLAIAYHNVGVEYEFLKKFDMSRQSYKKGLEQSINILGKSHGIVITLRNSLLSLKHKKDPSHGNILKKDKGSISKKSKWKNKKCTNKIASTG